MTTSTVEIPLRSGHVLIVDEDDLPLIEPYTWHVTTPRSMSIYARSWKRIGGKKICVLMHRLLLNAPRNVQVDHRDNNGLNNSRSNLRFCTNGQNAANRHNLTTNTSGYKGVTYHRQARRWQAAIKVDGRNHYLGLFREPELAALAYDRAAVEIHGDFAHINGVTRPAGVAA